VHAIRYGQRPHVTSARAISTSGAGRRDPPPARSPPGARSSPGAGDRAASCCGGAHAHHPAVLLDPRLVPILTEQWEPFVHMRHARPRIGVWTQHHRPTRSDQHNQPHVNVAPQGPQAISSIDACPVGGAGLGAFHDYGVVFCFSLLDAMGVSLRVRAAKSQHFRSPTHVITSRRD
jgi:hypothetical protein